MKKWRSSKERFEAEILPVIEELKDEWPLTIRQVYYQLVTRQFIENNKNAYHVVVTDIAKARMEGYLDWEAIEDRVRAFHSNYGWVDWKDRLSSLTSNLAKHYYRDLMQSQWLYLELWVEKDALAGPFLALGQEYTIPVSINRGFTSLSFLQNYKDRCILRDSPTVLFFSDFDPSGMGMLSAISKRFKEMSIDAEVKRIALTAEDAKKLPSSFKPVNPKDPRTKEFVKAYGNRTVELDAMPPADLRFKIRSAINSEIDADTFKKQQRLQELDRKQLRKIEKQLESLTAKR